MLDRVRALLHRQASPDALAAAQKMPAQLRRIESKERRVNAVRRKSQTVLAKSEQVRKELATGNWATDLLLDRPGRTEYDPDPSALNP